MLNDNDFIFTQNGKGRVKLYSCTCDECGANRGYKRKREKDRKCSLCANKPSGDYSNVDFSDFKITNNGSKGRIYKMSCKSCKEDRGYKRLTNSQRLCRSCSYDVSRRNTPLNRPGIDILDFTTKVENQKSTRRLYRMSCITCSSDRGYKRPGRYGYGMCKRCVSSYIHKGKTVSDNTRQKMSDNSWIANGGKHPMAGKKHTDATKAKLSMAATLQNKKYKGNFKYDGIGGAHRMRSSWEVKYAMWLDTGNIKWEYEPTFELSNGKMYTPDFKLEDGTIIEIKGYFREDAKVKWQLFERDYPKVKKKLLMKHELKELGVL